MRTLLRFVYIGACAYLGPMQMVLPLAQAMDEAKRLPQAKDFDLRLLL